MWRMFVGIAMVVGVAGAGLAQSAPACTSSQISAATDAENGNFDGMSHSGTLLVLRNIGPTACSVAGFPQLTFMDAAGKALAIGREVPKGMHPGPVIVPVTVVPGAEVTATLRWVSGDVYSPRGECFAAASVSVKIGDGMQTAKLGGESVRGEKEGDVSDDAYGGGSEVESG